MFQQTRKAVALIGGATGLSLVLGVTAAASVASRPDAGHTAAASVPAGVIAPADVLASAEAPATTEPAAPPETVVTAPPTTSAAERVAEASPAEEASADVPADVAAAPQPTVVARLNPSSAQVVAAMQAMKARIPLLPLDESYGRQFGDQVCTAFDQGSSHQQVLAAVLAEANKVPLVSVSSADADFAVRTAVQLFCPGHLDKL